MRKFTVLFYILAVVLGLFGYWGLFTKSGSAYYEEMSGFIPFFAIVISIIFLLIALILSVILLIKNRRTNL